jgi:hypothetical protein
VYAKTADDTSTAWAQATEKSLAITGGPVYAYCGARGVRRGGGGGVDDAGAHRGQQSCEWHRERGTVSGSSWSDWCVESGVGVFGDARHSGQPVLCAGDLACSAARSSVRRRLVSSRWLERRERDHDGRGDGGCVARGDRGGHRHGFRCGDRLLGAGRDLCRVSYGHGRSHGGHLPSRHSAGHRDGDGRSDAWGVARRRFGRLGDRDRRSHAGSRSRRHGGGADIRHREPRGRVHARGAARRCRRCNRGVERHGHRDPRRVSRVARKEHGGTPSTADARSTQ